MHRNHRGTTMACYKTIDTSPRFLAVDLEAQLLPGTWGVRAEPPARPRDRPERFRRALQQRRHRRQRQRLPAGHAAQGRLQPGHRTRVPRARRLHRPERRHLPALHHHRFLGLWARGPDWQSVPASAADLRRPGLDRARDVRPCDSFAATKPPMRSFNAIGALAGGEGRSNVCCRRSREQALPTLSRPSIVEMGLLGAALREARNS